MNLNIKLIQKQSFKFIVEKLKQIKYFFKLFKGIVSDHKVYNPIKHRQLSFRSGTFSCDLSFVLLNDSKLIIFFIILSKFYSYRNL